MSLPYNLLVRPMAQRGTVRFASRSQKIDPEPESFDLPVNPEGAPQTVQNDRFVRRRTTTSIPLEKQYTSSASSRRELARAGQPRPTATRRSFTSTEEDGDPRKVRRLDQRAKQQIPSRSESPTRDTFARRVDTDVVDYLPPVTNEVVTTNTENVAINRRRPKQRQFREESTTTASSRPTVSRGRLERKSSRLTTETPKLSKAALEDVSGSSERPVGAIISRGTAKAVRKPSSDERDDGSSEENYPEPFKKLLKAKLIDNKLKSSYVKKLEDTPEKNKGGATRTYSTTEQPTKISRTLVRKPTSTEITVQISRRIIQEAAQQEDKTRENVSARNSRERSAPTKSSEQTYRSSRFSIEKSTSTEAFVETFRTSKESNESAQSGERLTSARQIRTRSRFTERSQQSSEEKIKNTVQSSKEVTSSGGLESAKYSKENDTNVNSAERLQSVAQEGRKNTDIRFRVKVLSTTTPGPTTTVKLITPRPVRTYTRRQNTLSYLTSTTTEPTTTTRKPFSPAPRNSSVVQRKPPSPVADTNVGKVTKVTAEPAQKPQRPTLSPRSSAGTRQPTIIARKAPASYTRQTTPSKPKADPEDGPRKISLLYTDPLQYLRRSTPSPVSPTKTTVAEDNENLVEAPAKKPFRGAQPRKSLPSRVGNGEAKTTIRPPQTSKPFANAALKRPPSFSSAGRGNKKAAVYTPTIPTFTTQSTVSMRAGRLLGEPLPVTPPSPTV
ncbi:hypothetical protein ZHAS_00005565 [Anopheles sinensis]|uniref:Uncharacterized protein n=1 Tax=Anopheles sinensis TaxID=74873 RepID=A0A084VJV2_ANOSI|nr:hypothetical protein ZHAS_00005565 [Anopheles sinensis]